MKVLIAKNKGLTVWQILDGQDNTVFSSAGQLQDDTVTFSLEANQYYFLKISVSEISNRDTSLC